MPHLNFTIDSHLLQELGDHLVGRPYIALAELVKNAYDADANHCEILFSNEEIEIWDDGHGMTLDEFRDFWMRIGTTNKVNARTSRKYERALTGSKGIGRLAVQFLANELELITTSPLTGDRLRANVDWKGAVEKEYLTEVQANYTLTKSNETYANQSETGTKVILRDLHHDWSYSKVGKSPIGELAHEVWMLQPPFVEAVRNNDVESAAFHIDLVANDERIEDVFRSELTQILDLWEAKITGAIRSDARTRSCEISVLFRDGDAHEITIPVSSDLSDRFEFEIRIFKLVGRQTKGVKVGDAKIYFKEFGGVHVYDSGFRLPYYGIEQDWLEIQLDHSKRLSLSKLLPDDLNVPLAMHDLPTMERIFGVVNISTTKQHQQSQEPRSSERSLRINISRDRLVDNVAYKELKRVVRWSIDYYTTRYQIRQEQEVSRLKPKEPPAQKLDRLSETISEIQPEISEDAHLVLVDQINDYRDSLARENAYVERQTALLAPLAAAGMASLAFEHEANRQLRRLKNLVKKLARLSETQTVDSENLIGLTKQLESWSNRFRESRKLFSSLVDEEDRIPSQRLLVAPTVRTVFNNTKPFLRGLEPITWEIPQELLFPMGSMAEWQALLQNIFINASNAMLDSELRQFSVQAGIQSPRRNFLRISDTGVGLDLDSSGDLFDPFVRKLELSRERKSLGLGGTGLGLTIVRMICETRNCSYRFVKPETGFSTTFEMEWTR